MALPSIVDKPRVTWALLAINIVVWLGMEIWGDSTNGETLIDFGAMFSPLIANGEYWRLFTAMFLHVGMYHLFTNGLGLFIFGPLVERSFGSARYLAIYVLAGLFGSVLSYNLNDLSVGAGASGALFGIMGAFAAFFVMQRKTFGAVAQRSLTGIAVLAVINFAFGLSTPGIDNWAHLGGLAGGFFLGLAFAPQYEVVNSIFGLPIALKDNNSITRRWWVLPAAAIVLAGGGALGTTSAPETPFTRYYVAERNFNQGDYSRALTEVNRAMEINSDMPEAHLLRGKIRMETGDYIGAQTDLARAVVLARAHGFRRMESEAIRLLLEVRARN
ncbi:MAG: rhomboid family intramembrane serine protease [SAR202 cluster bacterium]|nr:rhomboid family intramembrane serine protease [SAR202 cluster bacterium]